MSDAAVLASPVPKAARRSGATGKLVALALCGLALVAALAVDLSTGPSGMPLDTLLPTLLAGPHGADRMAATILWQLRMPEAAMATLVGACLGLSGLQMQTILDNPLASPFTLGFSAAAGFGAAVAILFELSLPLPAIYAIPVAAFFMTLVAAAIVYLIARITGASPEVLVLAGIAVLFFFQSLQSFLQYMASPEVLQQIVFWLFGSLQKSTWSGVMTVSVILAITLPFIVRDCWQLTALRLGEDNAASLGVKTWALRRRTFVLTALLTAAAVSFTGTIGFIGLIAPHAARALVGEDHRFALPMSALAGAAMLAGASAFGKTVSPGGVIPVGIVTAVIGVPVLFAILVLGRKGRPA